MDAFLNFAYATVASVGAPPGSSTTLTVGPGEGARFPAPPFNAVICPNEEKPLVWNAEIVRVTARTGDTLTIARTQEGSTSRYVLPGDQIFEGITKKTLDDLATGTGQPHDTTLDALAVYNTPGFLVQTAPDMFAGRILTAATLLGLGIASPDGVSGNPSIRMDLTNLQTKTTPINLDSVLIYDSASTGPRLSRFDALLGAIGGVAGPSSATNNAVALFDGTTGKLIKNSALTYDGSLLKLAGAGIPSLGFYDPSQPAGQKYAKFQPAGGGMNFYMLDDADTAIVSIPLQMARNGDVVLGGRVGTTSAIVIGAAPTPYTSGNNPSLYLYDQSQPANLRMFRIMNQTQRLIFYKQDDGESGWVNLMDLDRAGALSVHGSLTVDTATFANGGLTTPAIAVGSVANSAGLASGTFTPSIAILEYNISGATPYDGQYLRVGNVVTVSGKIDVNVAGANSYTYVMITLPIATSGFGAAQQLAGSFMVSNPHSVGWCEAWGTYARCIFYATVAGNQAAFYHYTYRVA